MKTPPQTPSDCVPSSCRDGSERERDHSEMWSYESARSQEVRRSGRCAITKKEFGPDFTIPIPSHHRVTRKQTKQRKQPQKQPQRSRSTIQNGSRDVEGIARLIQRFNSSIVIDGIVDETQEGLQDSSASADESIDMSKTCSKCKGERMARSAGAGAMNRRMLCQACAVKHGRRPRKKTNLNDGK